ncbi:hypothetical protein PENSPDRAFT_684963 [Peniophora sp. CONT]|nr:hypothetical protein PENSPDRAFT_684963 [Peniophora sp. CONT]
MHFPDPEFARIISDFRAIFDRREEAERQFQSKLEQWSREREDERRQREKEWAEQDEMMRKREEARKEQWRRYEEEQKARQQRDDEERKKRDERLREEQDRIRRWSEELKRKIQAAKENSERVSGQRQPAIKDAWAAYEAQRLSLPSQLEFRTILWPVLNPPSRVPPQAPGGLLVVRGLTRGALREFLLSPTHSVDMSHRARLQAALLRWHPDKMGKVMERVIERDQVVVQEGVKLVVGELAVLLREVSEGPRA